MALRTVVTLWDTAGDEADRLSNVYVATTYIKTNIQRTTLSSSTSKVKIDFGPVTTAQYIYISTDTEITVYFSNSAECRTVGDALLLIGCSETALHIVAASGAVLYIYIAGV